MSSPGRSTRSTPSENSISAVAPSSELAPILSSSPNHHNAVSGHGDNNAPPSSSPSRR